MDSACGQRILSHSPGPNVFFDPTGLYGNMSIYSSVRPSIEQDGPLRRRLSRPGIAVPTVRTRNPPWWLVGDVLGVCRRLHGWA